MKRVKVTFYLEPTDLEDSTGLEGNHYERVIHTIQAVGGDDFEIELVEEEDAEPVRSPRRKKG